MALTRDFKRTILARMLTDPVFRDALLKECVALVRSGEVDTSKLILHDCIETVGDVGQPTQKGATT